MTHSSFIGSFLARNAPVALIAAGIVAALNPAFGSCNTFQHQYPPTSKSSSSCQVDSILGTTCIGGICYWYKCSAGSYCDTSQTPTGSTCTPGRTFVQPYYMSYSCQQAWSGIVPIGCAGCDNSLGSWMPTSNQVQVPTCNCTACSY